MVSNVPGVFPFAFVKNFLFSKLFRLFGLLGRLELIAELLNAFTSSFLHQRFGPLLILTSDSSLFNLGFGSKPVFGQDIWPFLEHIWFEIYLNHCLNLMRFPDLTYPPSLPSFWAFDFPILLTFLNFFIFTVFPQASLIILYPFISDFFSLFFVLNIFDCPYYNCELVSCSIFRCLTFYLAVSFFHLLVICLFLDYFALSYLRLEPQKDLSA